MTKKQSLCSHTENDSLALIRQVVFWVTINGVFLMKDQKVTSEMVPIIKLARLKKYNYARIASYFQINQGRIADIMKGRLYPEIPAAAHLPPDFPKK